MSVPKDSILSLFSVHFSSSPWTINSQPKALNINSQFLAQITLLSFKNYGRLRGDDGLEMFWVTCSLGIKNKGERDPRMTP